MFIFVNLFLKILETIFKRSRDVATLYHKAVTLLGVFTFVFILSVSSAHATLSEMIAEADKAVANGDAVQAEAIYTSVLEKDSENYRVLRSLADIKIEMGKLQEAEALLGKILKMEVSTNRNVLVYMRGEEKPRPAELVDETVILETVGKNNMRNYLAPVDENAVPHFRLFFKDTGKMELVSKAQAQIRYVGVPRSTMVMVRERHNEVMVQLIADKGATGTGEMVSLEAGCFTMGNDNGDMIERPAHEVCLSAFKMDAHEVRQSEFQAVMKHNPSRFKGADLPVESVTYDEAADYCKNVGKRIPTEAEWEYAARAGTKTLYYWGDEFDPAKSNFCDSECELNLGGTVADGYIHTAPVGSFPPNPAGLYDMAGNVSEWVGDWMEDNYYVLSPKNDPKGPERMDEKIMRGGTNYKVIRGGSWKTNPMSLQSAARKSLWMDYRVEGLGFRCVSN
jgi:formylglycine-generating enzyme